MHAMANLAILTKSCHSINDDEFVEIAKLPKHRGHPCQLGKFDDFGECGKFGKV